MYCPFILHARLPRPSNTEWQVFESSQRQFPDARLTHVMLQPCTEGRGWIREQVPSDGRVLRGKQLRVPPPKPLEHYPAILKELFYTLKCPHNNTHRLPAGDREFLCPQVVPECRSTAYVDYIIASRNVLWTSSHRRFVFAIYLTALLETQDIKRKERVRKRTWLHLRNYLRNCLKGLSKTAKTVRQDSRCPCCCQ